MSAHEAHAPHHGHPTRRTIVKGSAALSAAALTGLGARAFAGEDNSLRIGLVGCGGRGSGAARQALNAHSQNKLVAMGDAFEHRLESSHEGLKRTDIGDRVEVDDDHKFVGFDAYKKVIEASDVVLLATPPHFRPMHIEEAVKAGRHVFAEKPVAVDATGARKCLEMTKLAEEKGLSLVSGLCWRYERNTQQLMERLHNGAVGDIQSLHTTRFGGGVWVRQREEDDTDMRYQMRNWYYFTWLSGDFNVEQFVHELDRLAWAIGDRYPESCISTGGRLVRTDEHHGHIYDHFATEYRYEGGLRLFATCRHWRGSDNQFDVSVVGTKGRAELNSFTITGENAWRAEGGRSDMYQREHNALFDAIRLGEPINNGEYMTKSTMMAIMARESAYTGKELTWEQAMESKQSLKPERYAWDAAPPAAEVAIPGQTEFV